MLWVYVCMHASTDYSNYVTFIGCMVQGRMETHARM
jgi:hypothetical protein